MLTPEYLGQIVRETEEYIAGVNDYLTAKTAQQIIKTYENTGDAKLLPSSVLNIRKQKNSGILLEEIQKAVDKMLPDMEKQVAIAFRAAGADIANDLNDATVKAIRYEQAHGNMNGVHIPKLTKNSCASKAQELNMTEAELAKLQSAYEATCGDIKNFTRTAPTTANEAYIKACDEAYMKVMHGVSLNTAIMDAIKELSRKGIEIVSYGRRKERIEVAVARAVRTGVNRANGDITLTRAAESGAKYVLVSQHIGARVTPQEDFTNHSWWQGQIYEINWNDPVMSKYSVQDAPNGKMSFVGELKDQMQQETNETYKDFIQTCGYGQMLGICGINCRHSFGLFYPGIMNNHNKPINKDKNRKRYENEQKLRSMERAIRKTKRELNTVQNTNTTDPDLKEQLDERRRELRKLLEKQSDTYMDFCKAEKLKPVNWRLQTARPHRMGLSAKDSTWEIPEHKTPILEGKIDLSSNEAIESVLMKFEMETVNEEIENACVITKEGEIYRCYGTENSVFPDADLKDKLIGAIVSHNHPSKYTEFSFSKADFELFNDYNLEVLRGVDVKYKYEFNRKKLDIDGHKSIFDLTEEDTAHEESIARAERSHIGYRRWSNE